MKKLVRDKIPDIIKNNGEIPNIEYISNKTDYERFLSKEKLLEEINEFINADNLVNEKEELADVFEVINAIIKFKNFNKNDIENIRVKKFQECGGFDKKIILIK